jgi:hypothetical protein
LLGLAHLESRRSVVVAGAEIARFAIVRLLLVFFVFTTAVRVIA